MTGVEIALRDGGAGKPKCGNNRTQRSEDQATWKRGKYWKGGQGKKTGGGNGSPCKMTENRMENHS